MGISTLHANIPFSPTSHTPPLAPPLFPVSPAVATVRLPGPFSMYRGGVLPQVEMAYEHWGGLSSAKDNVVLLFTGLSPGTHAAASPADPSPGWWEFMVGPGKPIDTRRYYVLCINSLGSCFGSTSPATQNPLTGSPYGIDFPELSVEDIARANIETLHALGIEHVHAVVGASLGGMSALAFSALCPQTLDRLVTISSAFHATPHAIAIRSLQREMIRCDPAWMGGRYPLAQGPVQGMGLARKLGVTSYRSAEEWQHRFDRKRKGRPAAPFGIEFEIESYLDYQAQKFIKFAVKPRPSGRGYKAAMCFSTLLSMVLGRILASIPQDMRDFKSVEYTSDLGNMGWLTAVKVPTWESYAKTKHIPWAMYDEAETRRLARVFRPV